ncbi:hypothetical protein [Agrobacterium sp. CFBP2214]|jgi:hypothetical protein|uniref:hypothetical protein n=1 Tax=Agrobacterium sp. CFBP2214 TaxID=3040274 RepID=UPI00101A7C9F|nr:hypothetical protein [Agrobacterium sp. CFBP2214]
MLRAVQRHVGEAIFVAIALALIAATAWASVINVRSSGLDANSAAWAQASGSILAIAAAAWIARGDVRRARRWRRDQAEEAAWHARFVVVQAQYDAHITAFELTNPEELIDGRSLRSWRQRASSSSLALQTMLTKVDHIHPSVVTTLCNAKMLIDEMEADLIKLANVMMRFEAPDKELVSDVVSYHQLLQDLIVQYDSRAKSIVDALDQGRDMLPVKEFASAKK